MRMTAMKRFALTLATTALTTISLSLPSLAMHHNAGGTSAHPTEMSSLGTVDFGAHCAAAVGDDDFDAAIALLHHMQYGAARAGFEQILANNPDCAMAHWGVAMTLFQPLWPSRPNAEALQRGFEEVQKAETLGLSSERDAALVTATKLFYQDPETADWWTRIDRWHQGMTAAYQAHPDDLETAVFYALSHLAAGQNQPDRLNYHAEAVDILRSVYERESTHPGAIHYTIHANDVDSRANESLDIVRSYGAIAPDVPHALHMPTHIFVRLGYWPEVIEWNRRSADAALHYPAADGLSHHYIHALDYLVHAYLQQGDHDSARAVIDEALAKDEAFQGTFISAFHLATMPARYALERRDWEEAQAIEPAADTSVRWEKFYWAEAISWFAQGMGAARMGDTRQAAVAIARMAALRDQAQEAGEEAFATYIEIDRLVLASWQAQARSQPTIATMLAQNAVDLEATIQKHPVSPGSIYPAQESLGDLLMALERPEEALAAYEASLVTWPSRHNSMLGATQAAFDAGLDDRAMIYHNMLIENSTNSISHHSVR